MSYDRPNQSWICGHSDEGNPCPLGPSRLGVCQHTGDCSPTESNGQWQCNRSKIHGGTCDHGPDENGVCGIHREQCSPLPSLRNRRGAFAKWCFAGAIALLTVILSAPWKIEALAPGDLTTAHAQILNRSVNANRCTACHASGDDTLAAWLVPAKWRHPNTSEPIEHSQSALCLHCHEKSFDRLTALNPHGIPVQELQELSANQAKRLGLTKVSSEFSNGANEFACSICHREHHGAMHNLSAMSNQQCVTCHTERFHKFKDHPEFTDWPQRRRSRIAFDHTSHQFKHFVKENKSFDCNACHLDSKSSNSIARAVSFESCRSCHEKGIVAPSSDGIVLFSLPAIDIGAFRRLGIDVGTWPPAATGDFDGELPPAMRMLMAGDPNARKALSYLGESFDFLDLDPQNREQMIHAAQLVFAIKRLMQRLAIPDAVEKEANPANQALKELEHRIPPVVVEAAVEHWMRPHRQIPHVGSLRDPFLAILQNRLSGATQLATDSSSPVRQASFTNVGTPDTRDAVGWFRDDETLTIGYRPTQHEDPVLVSLYQVLTANQSTEILGESASELFADIKRPTASGQCISCHSIDQIGDELIVNWIGHRPTETREFTKFSHTPHLILPQLSDCTTCHELDKGIDTTGNYADYQPDGHAGNFRGINKAACANCHSEKAAGETCLTCHNYHIDSPNRVLSADFAERLIRNRSQQR